MGHYYADLACSKCGKVRCVCPLEKSSFDPEKAISVAVESMIREAEEDNTETKGGRQ